MSEEPEILTAAVREIHRTLDRLKGGAEPSTPAEHSIAHAPELFLRLAAWLEAEAATWSGDEVHYACTPAGCTLESAAGVARTVLADAYSSCPGRELSPNPCRCPCYGCRHHCSAHNPEQTS